MQNPTQNLDKALLLSINQKLSEKLKTLNKKTWIFFLKLSTYFLLANVYKEKDLVCLSRKPGVSNVFISQELNKSKKPSNTLF